MSSKDLKKLEQAFEDIKIEVLKVFKINLKQISNAIFKDF